MRIFDRMPQSLTDTPGDRSGRAPHSPAGPQAMSVGIQSASGMSAGAAAGTEPRHVKVPYINERKKYDLIIAASGQIVYDYDLTTGDIVWSGSMAQVLGYEREEMGGIEEWAEMIHPDDRAEALRLLDVAEKERGTYDVDYRFRCKNGSYRWLHDRGFFLIEDDRNVRRMIGMMQDIHIRKQTELQQNAVYRIAQAADTSAGLGDLFKSVHNIFRAVMPAGNFYIALYDGREDMAAILERMADFSQAPFSPRDLSAWPIKVLLVFASGDPSTPPAVRKRLEALYPGCRTHVVEGAGRALPFEGRGEYACLIEEFLSRS
jgi:PAS domain S-box-containing protein